MAGRGCTITIKLLGGGHGNGETEEISLPVALHSPLEVLKQELAPLCGIGPSDQVLILCDLSDPDRNSDLLLTGRDYMTLRQIGITNGSVLTLHALGMCAEQQQLMMREAFVQKKAEASDRRIFNLETGIPASQADHSYNGVVFDVECNGPYEIDLLSVNIAGMLGRVRIFARDRPWKSEAPKESSPSRWWAHREGLSTEGWRLIADVHCRPSWDKPIEIKFREPVKLLPRQKRALYCHSSLPDDLGIQYQSYGQHEVIAEDEFIRLLPGLGHTGSDPFDDRHGWYRSYRGLAGGIKYYSKWKGWNMKEHYIFPLPLKQAVKTLLLAETRSAVDPNRVLVTSLSSSSPRAKLDYRKKSNSTSSTLSMTPESSPRSPTISSGTRLARFHISSLPRYVIIHIMEFMNYDWFKEVECSNETSPQRSSRKKNTLSHRFIHALGSAQPQNFVSSLLSFLQNSNISMDEDDEGDEEYHQEEEDDDDDDEDYDDFEEDEEENEIQVMEGVEYLDGGEEDYQESLSLSAKDAYEGNCQNKNEDDDSENEDADADADEVPDLVDEEDYHDISMHDDEYELEDDSNDEN